MEEMLSPFCKTMNLKCALSEKLKGTLRTQIKYKVHYRNSNQYGNLGMKVLRIHRTLAFEQRQWLKALIYRNTTMCLRAKSDCEKISTN
jgi:hypothetical protein